MSGLLDLVGFEPRSTKSMHRIWAKTENEQNHHTEREFHFLGLKKEKCFPCGNRCTRVPTGNVRVYEVGESVRVIRRY